MEKRLIGAAAMPLLACLALAAGGCSNVSVWPFGGDKAQGRTAGPANATEFRCREGKRFYVRQLDNGNAAWVILPEREFRLDKVAAAGTRYGNGNNTLDVNGNEATLSVAGATAYQDCKAAGGN